MVVGIVDSVWCYTTIIFDVGVGGEKFSIIFGHFQFHLKTELQKGSKNAIR